MSPARSWLAGPKQPTMCSAKRELTENRDVDDLVPQMQQPLAERNAVRPVILTLADRRSPTLFHRKGNSKIKGCASPSSTPPTWRPSHELVSGDGIQSQQTETKRG
ncbi:unnamed protein product [Protopolystoma xenopodis]|uniref:Uncharacterized protein n=1 Tax=Protopolystoma xenopodis TaxID=117903 RepID=A0A3S5FGK2_9PLAT|nr:unnamed protein product [Protopolystoma xenopodis]